MSSASKPTSPKSGAASLKVRRHRERLRAQGLRPIQLWVPDTRTPHFRNQAHLQSQAVAQGSQAQDDQGFIDAISDLADI